jgi:alpha-L-rhamnosidase
MSIVAASVVVSAGSLRSDAATVPSGAERAIALSNSPVPASNAWQGYVLGNDATTAAPVAAATALGNVTNPQALAGGSGVTTLTNVAGQAPPIVFIDYGKEVGGLPFFNVQSATPTSPATSVWPTER